MLSFCFVEKIGIHPEPIGTRYPAQMTTSDRVLEFTPPTNQSKKIYSLRVVKYFYEENALTIFLYHTEDALGMIMQPVTDCHRLNLIPGQGFPCIGLLRLKGEIWIRS
jgi:hypothetical protein